MRDGEEALARLARGTCDVLVTELDVGPQDGLAVAAEARRLHPETQVVVISGQGPRRRSCGRCARGSRTSSRNPSNLEQLALTVEKAVEKTFILRELVHLSRTDG